MEVGKVHITEDHQPVFGGIANSGRVVVPLPLSLQHDMYGHARLHVRDERGDWVPMRAGDADRIIRLLEDLKCLVGG